LSRNFTQRVGGWPGNSFRKLEQRNVFGLTKILRAKKFLQANDLRPLLCGVANSRNGFLEICFGLDVAAHLDQTHLDDTCIHFLGHVRKYNKRLAAVPLDVRKGSAFPTWVSLIEAAPPSNSRRSLKIIRQVPERQSLSAHQAAQPREFNLGCVFWSRCKLKLELWATSMALAL